MEEKTKKFITNKSLAILGTVSYLLSVLVSVEDKKGNFLVPIWLIIVSAIITIIFYVLALNRLLKYNFKSEFWLLLVFTIIGIILEMVVIATSPSNGNTMIILNNIVRVANFLIYFWVISIFWILDKSKSTDEYCDDAQKVLNEKKKIWFYQTKSNKIKRNQF